MADISMCNGTDCKLKETCYRYLAKESTYQSYLEGEYKDGECRFYWEVFIIDETSEFTEDMIEIAHSCNGNRPNFTIHDELSILSLRYTSEQIIAMFEAVMPKQSLSNKSIIHYGSNTKRNPF